MDIEKIKNQSFPEINFSDWERKAEETLKGRPADSLNTVTYENIILKPLYCKEDEKTVSGFPGGSDFRRGISPLGYRTDKWKVAQRISCQTTAGFRERLEQAVKRGQTALSFVPSGPLFYEKGELGLVLKEYWTMLPFAVDAGDFQQELLAAIENAAENQPEREKVTGFIGHDLISSFVLEGYLPLELETSIKEWAALIKKANQQFPNLETILINTSPYHNGGAHAVQELGIACAAGVYYLQQLMDQDLALEDILPKMVFQFSVGSNFFMEIAKLRAARILWDKITGVYGAGTECRGMKISAETSMFTKTVFDKQVNILRAGSEAFAAVIANVQYLHVTPFDETTGASPFSERIARNTQLILEHETHLDKTADPSGGSWYIEELTREMAEKAWKYFQEIEEHGGIVEVLKTSRLQNEISAVLEKRRQDIFSRKRSIVGTNVYANLEESGMVAGEKQARLSKPDKDRVEIRPIPQVRLSMPYEELRALAQKVKEQTGAAPEAGLICLGSLKSHKARADFMKGFLAAGGIEAKISGTIISEEMAVEFVENSSAVHFCICGSNEQYEEMGHDILISLKAAFPEKRFFLAGLPEKEIQPRWKQEGIEQFIHVKSNCFETLSGMLTNMGVNNIEKTEA